MIEPKYFITYFKDSAKLPSPEVLAQDIADNMEDALEQIKSIVESLNSKQKG